jgi:succinoglycan biosynthesis protein ExoA
VTTEGAADVPPARRTRSRAEAEDLANDLVTVVIPARDEAASIDACLDSVLGQSHRNLQVIVVDGASTDATPDRVRERAHRDPRVELLANPAAIIPVSLNLALSAARGRWFVRIDAHATVPPDYVAMAIAHLRGGRYAAVGGRKDGVGVTPAGRAIAAAMASPFGVGNSAYHYATEEREVDHVPFGAYSVEVARQLGGWDERLTVNQDFEFDHRLRRSGHRILLDPEMVIHWHSRQSIRELFAQYHRYGRGKAAVARLHPSSVALRHLAAPALVLSWAIAAVLFASGRRRLASALLAPYASGLVLASVRVAAGLDDGASKVRVLPAFLAMHGGWGWGFLQGVIVAMRRDELAGPRPDARMAGRDGRAHQVS